MKHKILCSILKIMSASSSMRLRTQDETIEDALQRLASVHNFEPLCVLQNVTINDINVEYSRHQCEKKNVVSKEQFTNAITDSQCVIENFVPLELIQIIADSAYTCIQWKDEVESHLPPLRSQTDDDTLITMHKLGDYEMMHYWFPGDQFRENLYLFATDFSEQTQQMLKTMTHTVEILQSKCWTSEMFYQRKQYDEEARISMIFSGISRQSTENYLHILRVYVHREREVIDVS